MKVRALYPLAAAIGICVGGPALAKEPAKAAPAAASQAGNQKLAEAVAERLATTGSTVGADVTIVSDNGTVTVSGPCRDAKQKSQILSEVRVVSGVKLVRDGLTIGSPVRQAQATAFGNGPFAGGQVPAYPPAGNGGPLVEPAPLGAPGAGPADGFAPPLPPYAWPTYAPHNNASRIAYPQSYPYNAFPFIGPFYPFPKVPLGWRSVSLTWEDGHWWYGRTSTSHDYWRVRFW